jgi:hypothetical protein
VKKYYGIFAKGYLTSLVGKGIFRLLLKHEEGENTAL